MADVLDISTWSSLPWYSTGGTRAKKYLSNPSDNKTYYFKKSIDKYPYEFWSEIVAYELGKILNLDVLEYKVAIFENEIGCVSQSMIDKNKEDLIEGGKYLQAFDATFSPDEKNLRYQYTFQLIEAAFAAFKLEQFFPKIFEIMIFDCIIGNSDRHQENWAFIGGFSSLSNSLSEVEYIFNSAEIDKLPKWLKKLLKVGVINKGSKMIIRPEMNKISLGLRKNIRFAPFYDNGSSLARECTSDKIQSMLKNTTEFDAYVRRGQSEIHWEQEKVSHFQIIQNLLNSEYKEQVKIVGSNILRHYDEISFQKVLKTIDVAVNKQFNESCLPEERKEIIIKLVTSRTQKLRELFS